MSSLSTSSISSAARENSAGEVLHWRCWPLADSRQWSWAVLVGILAVGGEAAYLSGTWLVGIVVSAIMAAALWLFLLPATYEINSLGFRRTVLGRTRTVPWHAIRSYRPLTSGIVLYQQTDPTAVDSLRSLFLPYPHDEDEMLIAVRGYLGHAMELT